MSKIIGQSFTVVAKKLVRNGAEITPLINDEAKELIEEVLSETLGVVVELDSDGLGEAFEIVTKAEKSKA